MFKGDAFPRIIDISLHEGTDYHALRQILLYRCLNYAVRDNLNIGDLIQLTLKFPQIDFHSSVLYTSGPVAALAANIPF